ncbi:hypothetical protein PF005_g6455 [Phytophthora fragariae]|uniref:Uncharacterized protein n=3 Tax=Phytophthora TaxID=4783 RepID=A0A6A4EC55_9STRA|nr:hypothetical protein PF003_g26909 [Phytophthora fragariae]KAE9051463.1 hypothetical protein PR001_g1426 [Phytophthora rubi]KAE8942884.1 hypothetical protein PF009_g7374 [Phytophthora fragariae]KAE9020162.1 hypothetical protein PF011_g5531 [Phytophthora fragariae]KAE9124975.1 hypothetical protein PF010_g5788 [Phytophthora fragariae]
MPVGKDMEVLAMNGKLKPGKLCSLLKMLGGVETPLENKEDVHTESDDKEVKKRMIELLRAYRKVLTSDGGCPPMTTLDAQHHMDRGDHNDQAQRQAQTEDAITEGRCYRWPSSKKATVRGAFPS